MDYNLCKELKEAGFPNSDAWLDNGNGFWVDMGEFSYAVPTLEELIEVCGDKFWRMIKAGKSWTVEGGIGTGDLLVFGSNPSESVARLWLSINKK